jgi:hypothetical protein
MPKRKLAAVPWGVDNMHLRGFAAAIHSASAGVSILGRYCSQTRASFQTKGSQNVGSLVPLPGLYRQVQGRCQIRGQKGPVSQMFRHRGSSLRREQPGFEQHDCHPNRYCPGAGQSPASRSARSVACRTAPYGRSQPQQQRLSGDQDDRVIQIVLLLPRHACHGRCADAPANRLSAGAVAGQCNGNRAQRFRGRRFQYSDQ